MSAGEIDEINNIKENKKMEIMNNKEFIKNNIERLKKILKNEQESELLTIEKNVIFNNIQKIVLDTFKNEILLEIFEKYHEKNIGEKTKEKIEKEISQKLYELLGIYVDMSFHNEIDKNIYGSLYAEDFKFSFCIYESFEICVNKWNSREYKQGKNKLFDCYINAPQLYIRKKYICGSEEKEEIIKIWNSNIIKTDNNYIAYINLDTSSNIIIQENTKAFAKKVLSEKNKLNEKCKKAKEELEEIRKKYYKNFAFGNLKEYCKLEKIFIYY